MFNIDLTGTTNKTDKEIYEYLISQIENLVKDERSLVANLANITAALKQSFKKISWVGFYLVDKKNEKELVLNAFQGKVACTRIKTGQGVCGISAQRRETIIVNDVSKFPGHIYCDHDSKSEIVVPIIIENELLGVLDLDSYRLSAFTEVDKNYLEELLNKVLYIFKNE